MRNFDYPKWNSWAKKWLSGKDRTKNSAEKAIDAAGHFADMALAAEIFATDTKTKSDCEKMRRNAVRAMNAAQTAANESEEIK